MPEDVNNYLIDCYNKNKTLQESIDFAHKESPNVSRWVEKHSEKFKGAWISKVIHELNS